MSDLEIIKQLYDGNHLSKEELLKAKTILYGLAINLKGRVL